MRGLQFILLAAAASTALSAPPEPRRPAASSPGSRIRIASDNPERMLRAVLLNSARMESAEDFAVILAGIDAIQADRTAKAETIREAGTLKTRVLYMGSVRYPERFADLFEAHANTLRRSAPGSDDAALADSLRWVRRFTKQDRLDDSGEPDLLELCLSYPKAAIVAELAAQYAERLEPDAKAAAFLDKAIQALGSGKAAESLRPLRANRGLLSSLAKLEGPTTAGTELRLPDLRGKVVLVVFWAAWCQPSLEDLPFLQALEREQAAAGLQVIGVSLDENLADLSRKVNELKLSWPQVFFPRDDQKKWQHPWVRSWGIARLPTVVLIGRDGRVLARDLRGRSEIRKAVVQAAGDPPPAP